MLTADLVRGTLRLGVVHPRFVKNSDAAALADAESLRALFRAAEGDTVGELTEAIESAFSGRPDILFIRGLTKLLFDLTDLAGDPIATRTDPDALVTPEQLRATVFALAASRHPVRPGGGDGFHPREEVLKAAAEALDLTMDDVERGLYADLATAQRVGPFPNITPRELLDRYNLALAQACLLRAREVRVTLDDPEPKRLQALLRALKFRRVLFQAACSASPSDSAKSHTRTTVALTLDGPLSLFKHTTRYGVALALILPELARCERYTLEADIRWGRERRDALLKLSDRSPLTAHTPDRGVWVSAEERHLIDRMAAMDTPWRLEPAARVIDLDGLDVLCPDYVLSHPDGREALLELVFAWKVQTFERRLGLLARAAPPNLIVALTDRGRLDGDHQARLADLARPRLLRFKGLIQPRQLVALAQDVAIRPEPPPAEETGKPARAAKRGKPTKARDTAGEAPPSPPTSRGRARVAKRDAP